jgi:REP element-mobilizing transposase RayT
MEDKKLNKHRPFHIYDGHTYFLTGRCYKGIDYFEGDDSKEMFRNKLGEISKELDVGIFSWVILNNHYHILFRLDNQSGMTSASLSQGA